MVQRAPRPWQVTAPRGAITKISPHSYAAHIAGAARAELHYETAELAKVRTILDEGPEFGTALGGVDFMVARYVTVARIKAAWHSKSAGGRHQRPYGPRARGWI